MLNDLALRVIAAGEDSWNPLVGEEGYPPNVIPSDQPTLGPAGPGAEVAFFFIAGAAVVILALRWAIRSVINSRNWMPLIVMVGGLICSLEEAMLDMLGHLHWAPDLAPAYT